MNAPADPIRQRKNAALIALLGVSLLFGILDSVFGARSGDQAAQTTLMFASNISVLLIGFRWLHLDALQLDIRRPNWLNVAIILMAAVFVPYYFYKTRPAGLRAAAIGRFFLLVFACMCASAVGALVMLSLRGGPPL